MKLIVPLAFFNIFEKLTTRMDIYTTTLQLFPIECTIVFLFFL